MITYGQGSTIGFYIEGDLNISLDANDFKVLFYKKNSVERQEITKAQMTVVSANKYYGEIPHTLTEIMPEGIYIQDIRLGTTYRSVKKAEAFIIEKTEIR